MDEIKKRGNMNDNSEQKKPKTLEFGEDLSKKKNFSLVLGGPLFQLLCRAHLSDDALMLVRKRVIVISLFSWLPLLILSTLEGHLLGGDVLVPFFMDLEVHLRFLLAVPLFVIAELVVHKRMSPLIDQFLERELISKDDMPSFKSAIASALRLRNSILAEVLLILIVYFFGIMVIWRQFVLMESSTWFAKVSGDITELSLAGKWFAYVSLPFFQFLMIRWYFRLFIWARFLWQVSRVELRLIPTNPDRAGGLGFISNIVYAFVPLAMAHGVLLAGLLANRIFYTGAKLTDFKMEIATLVLFLLVLIVGPLLFFVPQLLNTKRKGLREYGSLAQRYDREFDDKWLRGGASADEKLMGSADIQSLADLGNSFDVIREMKIAPVTRDVFILISAAVLAPIVPLALTMMPLEELIEKLFGILF